ncbi:MAG TPA: polysaccharide deacetylase family protein [Tissierellaceae bacterium]|nr:polysaccharide deacetylase family protein [Tissierellaceae bacterium]
MKENHHNYKIYIYIGLILIFALLLGYKIRSRTFNNSEIQSDLDSNPKKIGEMKTSTYYDTKSAIAIHYPRLKNKHLNKEIDNIIDKYTKSFNTLMEDETINTPMHKGELNIDYHIYNAAEDVVSIRFDIMENLPYYAHPDIDIYTINYDLSRNKRLYLEDILKGKYLETISQASKDYFRNRDKYKKYTDTESFKQGLAPIENNYSHFLLCDNYINFLFPKYTIFPGYLGISEVKIPYEQVSDHIKPKFLERNTQTTFSMNEPENLGKIDLVDNRQIDPDIPMIALTFDDGPHTPTTGPILDTLKEYDSVATFFVLGNRIPDNGNMIKRIVEEGSEIGNHSYNHKQLTTISSTEVEEQINQTQDAVMKVSGIEPQLMRPTYGSFDEKLKSQVDMPIVLWSIDTEDWKHKNPDKIVNHVLDNVKDGDIILMHDIYTSTAEAVEGLVPTLIERGYQLVTVSELYEIQGKALEVGNIYDRR